MHEVAYFQREPSSGPGTQAGAEDACDGVILRHGGRAEQTCDVLVLAGEPLRGRDDTSLVTLLYFSPHPRCRCLYVTQPQSWLKEPWS